MGETGEMMVGNERQKRLDSARDMLMGLSFDLAHGDRSQVKGKPHV
jgi:hypothetical protein